MKYLYSLLIIFGVSFESLANNCVPLSAPTAKIIVPFTGSCIRGRLHGHGRIELELGKTAGHGVYLGNFDNGTFTSGSVSIERGKLGYLTFTGQFSEVGGNLSLTKGTKLEIQSDGKGVATQSEGGFLGKRETCDFQVERVSESVCPDAIKRLVAQRLENKMLEIKTARVQEAPNRPVAAKPSTEPKNDPTRTPKQEVPKQMPNRLFSVEKPDNSNMEILLADQIDSESFGRLRLIKVEKSNGYDSVIPLNGALGYTLEWSAEIEVIEDCKWLLTAHIGPRQVRGFLTAAVATDLINSPSSNFTWDKFNETIENPGIPLKKGEKKNVQSSTVFMKTEKGWRVVGKPF